MPFLKNKIIRAREAYERSLTNSSCDSPQNSVLPSQINITTGRTNQFHSPSFLKSAPFVQKDTVKHSKPKPPKILIEVAPSSNLTKNIVINFGKAISSFAISPLAAPYLEVILKQLAVDMNDFMVFAAQSKMRIVGISTFRSLLLIEDKDDDKTVALKKAFGMISEVFIKYFSVNWITHGRVTNKLLYLKYRCKMLRRVQNPEQFTYMIRRSKSSTESP